MWLKETVANCIWKIIASIDFLKLRMAILICNNIVVNTIQLVSTPKCHFRVFKYFANDTLFDRQRLVKRDAFSEENWKKIFYLSNGNGTEMRYLVPFMR